MNTLVSPFQGKSKTKQKPGKTATTRKSSGQICVLPAGKTENNTKKGEPLAKIPTPKTRICLEHGGKPNVSLRNKLASLRPESMAWKGAKEEILLSLCGQLLRRVLPHQVRLPTRLDTRNVPCFAADLDMCWTHSVQLLWLCSPTDGSNFFFPLVWPITL